MTKTSPFIPHDILPANIKTPLCWIQQNPDGRKWWAQHKRRTRELRRRRRRSLQGWVDLHDQNRLNAKTRGLGNGDSDSCKLCFLGFPKSFQGLHSFKVCRCKHYAHSQLQPVNGSSCGQRLKTFHLVQGYSAVRSYLPTFLASQSHRANNPWVSLQHKARKSKGSNATMSGRTNGIHKCARSSPNRTLLQINVACTKRRGTIPSLL